MREKRKPGRPKKYLEPGEQPVPSSVERETETDLSELALGYPGLRAVLYDCSRTDRQMAYVSTEPVDAEFVQRVAEKYGAGEYFYRLKNADGSWVNMERNGVKGGGRFTVSEKNTPVRPSAAPPAPAVGMDNQILLTMLQNQTNMLTAVLTATISKQPPPPVDPIALLVGLKQLLPAPDAGGGLAAVGQAMGLINQARELVPGGGDGAPQEPGMLGQITSGLASIATIVEKTAAQPARIVQSPPTDPRPPRPEIVQGHRAQPIPLAAPLAPEPQPTEDQPVNVLKFAKYAFLSPFIPELVRLASLDRDPVTYADVFMDKAEEKGISPETVLKYVQNAEMVKELCESFPAVVPFAAWFERFRVAIWESLTPPAGDDSLAPDESTAPGSSDAQH